jgi:putative flippase GtrA
VVLVRGLLYFCQIPGLIAIIVPRMELIRRVLVGKTSNYYIQFLRYGLISVVALAVDFGGLVILKQYGHINYLIAATISFIGGLLVNYYLSLLWVFHKSKFNKRATEFALFALIGVVGLILNDSILWILTSGFGIFYVFSKVAATVIVYFWNFGIRKKYLFD